MTLATFFADRRAKQAIQGRAAGFNWAAGELLRGVSPEEIESRVYRREDDALFSQGFDSGVYDALRAWSKL